MNSNDDILAQYKAMKAENERLRQELARMSACVIDQQQEIATLHTVIRHQQEQFDRHKAQPQTTDYAIDVGRLIDYAQQQTDHHDMLLLKDMLHNVTDDINDAELHRRINNIRIKPPQPQQIVYVGKDGALTISDIHDNHQSVIQTGGSSRQIIGNK